VNKNLLSFYGLKWNPFAPDLPTEACRVTPRVEHFCQRMESLAREGGYALVTGDPGTGKSVALRILVSRLGGLRDVTVGVLTRPQGTEADFYRELGAIFGVALSPHNRWAGANVLREMWKAHIEASLLRPVLVVDEAQQMRDSVFDEMRLLTAAKLDAQSLLTVVLAGDLRLVERLRESDLTALASRIRVRLPLDVVSSAELAEYLRHATAAAGNSNLMTAELVSTLAEHAAGNLRLLMNLSAELLEAGAKKELARLDEKLYLEVFSLPSSEAGRKRSATAAGAR